MSEPSNICYSDQEVLVSCHPDMRELVTRALIGVGLRLPVFADRSTVETHACEAAARLDGYREASDDMSAMADLIDAALEYTRGPWSQEKMHDEITKSQRVRAMEELSRRLRGRAEAAEEQIALGLKPEQIKWGEK